MSVRTLGHTQDQPKKATPEAVDFYWDSLAKSSMGRYITAIEAEFITKSLASLGAKPDLIVDAGAGNGRFTRLLSTQGERVIATEMKAELIGTLAQIGPNVTAVPVKPGSVRLPLKDASADCIVCIEAADLTQESRFHQECRRVLKPGGLLILTLQNRRSWKGVQARARRQHYHAEHSAIYYSWSLDDLTSSLRAAGLEVTDAMGFNWLPFTRTSNSRLIGPLSKIEGFLQLRRLAMLSPWVILSARRDDQVPS